MGMFDYFICDTSCPICGNYINEPYQTKSFDNVMSVFRPGNKVFEKRSIHVYNHCVHETHIDRFEDNALFTSNKAVWIEYEIPIIKGRIPKNMNLWKLQELKEVQFNGITFIPDGLTHEDIIVRYLMFNEKRRKDIKAMCFEKQKYDMLDLII
jgi:hypothetical protein